MAAHRCTVGLDGLRCVPRVAVAALSFVASVVGLASARGLLVGAVAMLALGASWEICRTGSFALAQTSIQDALRGRVMSTWFLILRGAGALGVVATGAAADGWGLRTPLLAGAALAALAWVYFDRARIVAAFAK